VRLRPTRYVPISLLIIGFGKTTAKYGSIGVTDGVENTLADLKAVSEKGRVAGAPHFVMGHSYGGFLALYFAHKHPEGLAGAISCSPALFNLPGLVNGLLSGINVLTHDTLVPSTFCVKFFRWT
jgi:alpha-beta hydrolase superfamily lysophospholipase